MYTQYYNFTKPPFENIPDPAFLYKAPQHERALSVLRYALLSRTGFCVITGSVGAGKTTLVRSVLYDLGDAAVVGLVSNTHCDSFDELMQWILLAFDLDYKDKDKVEMYDDLIRFLIQKHDDGQVVTLIIDEAQHLDLSILEQLRMLSNVNTERGQLLQIILVGQPELTEMLRRPEIRQFAQRISYDYFLEPLSSPKLVESYVRHRLSSVADRDNYFEDDTFELIYRASGGVPRLINLICDNALLYAFAESLETVPKRIIEQVLKDKRLGLAPLQTTQHVKSADAPSKSRSTESIAPSKRTVRKPNVASTIERAVMRHKDA